MAGLSSELHNRCRATLLKCSEFDSNVSLRAVFVTAELSPFRDGLPDAPNKSSRVDTCLDYLLPKRLNDGRPVLPLFLAALRDRYQEGDALRNELGKLAEDVGSALTLSVTPAPERRPESVPSVEPAPMPPTGPQAEVQVKGISDTVPSSPLRGIITIAWIMVALFLADLIFSLVLLWRFVGGLPNALSYIEAVTGLIGLILQIVALFVALRVREMSGRDLLMALGTRHWIQAAIIVMTVILAGLTVWPLLKGESLSSTDYMPTLPVEGDISAAIVSPVEGKEVSLRTRVQGTALNVPGDQQLWVLVQASGVEGYYPQPGPVEIDAAGAWETVTRIGTTSELEWHRPFTITVVLADAAAGQQFSEVLGHWPAGKDKGIPLPKGVVVLDSVGVLRNNPIVTLGSHGSGTNVGGQETLTGTYVNLEPGNWHLYSVVEAGQGCFMPFGPFEPEASDGVWAIEVEFPWPADGEREISFYALAVLWGTEADETLQSAVGSSLSAQDLSDEDWANIYGPVAKTSLIRAERIAFASDKPGNDDIFVINSDGSGLMRLTDDPSEDSDPAWSPDGTRIVFASRREGTIQLFVIGTDDRNVRRVITDSVVPARAPNWSPDGEWIAFHSEQGGNTDLYKVRADGTDLTRLTDALERDSHPVWSPNGEHILFLSDRAEDDAGCSELYVMDANGGDMTRLTHNEGKEGYATWSPDGQRILFVSEMEGSRDIYLMDADGSNVTWLANVDYDRHPTFAPDGQRFVFDSTVNRQQLFLATLQDGEPTQIRTGLAKSSSPAWSPVKGDEHIAFVGRFDGDWEIYSMWDDGTDLLRLMDTESNEVQPRISPDGRQVAFASDIDGDYEIWLEDARTPAPWIRLTNNTGNDWQPAWSPDGRKLAFASDRDGDWDIYVMNANGTGVVQLTNDPAEDSFPAWSSDGKRIVFYSGRSGDGDIYVMDAVDGGNVTPLVANPGFDWSPAWSPDGSTLVFASARDYGGTYATELYALDLLSGDLSRLTDYDGHDAIPLWSGDGRCIYFTSDRYWGIDDIWGMDADGSNAHNLTEDDRSDIFGGP